jgi:hypothetical protein
MPYAPGVQDISGQLRAQGIAQAGQAWSQAIGSIGKDLGDAFQTYKQNQFITNQALGKFAGATQSDPSMLRFLESGGADQEDPNAPKANVSPELLKAYSNAKAGKIGLNDAAVLSAFSDSWQKNKMEQVQRQHYAMQNALAGTSLLDTANQLEWYSKQPGAQGVNPQTIQALRAMGMSGLGQRIPMAAGAAPMAPAAPAGQMAPSQAGMVMPAAAPMVAPASGQPAVAPTAASAQQSWLNRNTPPTLEDADYTFRMANQGRRPKEGATKELLAEMRKQWDENQTIKNTFTNAQSANEAIKSIPPREGVTYAAEQLQSGRWIIKPQIIPKNVLSGPEQADLAEENRLSEAAVKLNQGRIALGDAAAANRGNLGAMRQAAMSPNLYTGVGAEAVNAMKQFAQGLGMNVKGVEDFATLKRLSGEQVLKKVALLRPASDTDIRLLQGYLAGPVQTEKANLALISMLERQDAYDMKLAKETRRLRSLKEDGKRLPEKEIDARMAQWEADNAISLTDDERKAFESIPQTKPVVTGTPGSASFGRSVSNAIDSTLDPIGAAFAKWMSTSTPQK